MRDAIVSVIILVFSGERAKIVRKRCVWTLFFFENGQTKFACVHPDTCIQAQKKPNLVSLGDVTIHSMVQACSIRAGLALGWSHPSR